jgi:hypothetical protein
VVLGPEPARDLLGGKAGRQRGDMPADVVVVGGHIVHKGNGLAS